MTKNVSQSAMQSTKQLTDEERDALDHHFGWCSCESKGILTNVPLHKIVIPLPELRQTIVDTMKQGQNVMDLEEFLVLVRSVYRRNKD